MREFSRVPAIGMFLPVAIGDREDQGDHDELTQNSVEKRRNNAAGVSYLAAEEERGEDDQLDYARDSQVEHQDANVEGKQRRADEFAAE